MKKVVVVPYDIKWKTDFIKKYNLIPSEDEYLYTL